MKGSYTLLIFLTLTFCASAQQITNGGFETWTNPTNPDGWGTIASAFQNSAYDYMAIRDNTANNFVEGSASLKMITDTITISGSHIAIASQAGLGSASYIPGQGIVFSGMPYTKRIDTIFFSYKYAPARPTDTALIQIDLSHSGTSIFAHGGLAIYATIADTVWQNSYFAIPGSLYVNGTLTPDLLRFVLYSSIAGNGQDPGAVNSTLRVDGIALIDTVTVTSIAPIPGEVKGVNVFPNPADSRINVTIEADEIGSVVHVYDMAGCEVYTTILNSATQTIDTKSLLSGTYSLMVNSVDKLTTYQGKITVEH